MQWMSFYFSWTKEFMVRIRKIPSEVLQCRLLFCLILLIVLRLPRFDFVGQSTRKKWGRA